MLGPGRFEIEPTPGGADEEGNESGDLDTGPAADLRIAGAGAGASVIDALLGGRAFEISPGSRVALEGLTIRRGRSGPGAPGGAIQNQGALSVVRASFEDNATGAGQDAVTEFGERQPGGAGGAIWSGGPANPSVLVAESTFTGNATGRGGAGLSAAGRASGGDTGGAGGAIAFASGTGEISGSTFARNRAGDGGPGGATTDGLRLSGGDGGPGGALAVFGGAIGTVVNSTFAGNAAGAAGAPLNGFMNVAEGGAGGATHLADGTLRVSWSTFAGNARGANAPDVLANGVQGGQVSASVLADAAPACGGLLPPTLRNVVTPGDTSCPPPRLEGDARLGPLGANGGPTPTLLPGAGSAAVDALVGVPCPATDQRGLPRPRFGGCDAGAIEVQPGEPVAPSVARAGTGTGAKARRVSSLQLRPTAFRAAGSGGSIGRLLKALTQRKPIGATVSYRLDGAARVTFTITRPVARPAQGPAPACARAPPGPGPGACLRQKKLRGSFAHQGVAGQNSFRFTGRLRRKALALGPYRLVAKLPRPATGRAALAGKGFRIVR